MSLQASDLVGAWMLHEFVIEFEDGRPPIHPFGTDAKGMIIYAETGEMSAVLSRAERDDLSETLETSGRATDSDKAVAFDSYLSYCGRYSLDADVVTHHVQLALVPDIVGANQRRHARLQDGMLELSYNRTPQSGVQRTYRLTWTRK